MARHLLQRFLLTLPALWLVLTLVFLMIHIVPVTPSSRCWVKRRGTRGNHPATPRLESLVWSFKMIGDSR
jgi:ABC-type microcin C transport system permease subunit YejB